MRAAQTFQNKPNDHVRGITKLGFPSLYSPNVEGTVFQTFYLLQATFLYSIYHQRAGKTNLFHMRGGRFHAGNTYVPAGDEFHSQTLFCFISRSRSKI